MFKRGTRYGIDREVVKLGDNWNKRVLDVGITKLRELRIVNEKLRF